MYVMKRKMTILLVLAAIAIIVVFAMRPTHVAKDLGVDVTEGVQIVIDGYQLDEVNKSMIDKQNAIDTVYTFDVRKNTSIGELEITLRELDNGDQFVFTKFLNKVDEGTSIPFKLIFSNANKFKVYPFSEEIPQEHDRVFGIDYTTNVKGLYTLTGQQSYQLYLSQNYISKELVETYDNGDKSVLRELVNEDDYLDVIESRNGLTFNLKLRTTAQNQLSENWFLLSKEPLFSAEDEMSYYKNLTNRNFINSPKWQTASGIYTKLPWSVEPSTKVGYGRNLVSQQGKTFAKRYTDTEERFYYDMLVNSVNYLLDFKGQESLWKTEYTSTWLKREYGIIAPYVDTRHNENIALFISQAGEILNNETLKNSNLLYGNFLSTQNEVGNTLLTEYGYYVLDYFYEHQTKKTHVSLNHALGEMNFLLELYGHTKVKKYLETALSIKRAVEDTGRKWINDSNGDLWYQINGDYTFEGKDYDTLTLEDLVAALKNYEELEIAYEKDVYEALMTTKIRFIIDNEVEIHSILHENLQSLGFGYLVDDYAHVFTY